MISEAFLFYIIQTVDELQLLVLTPVYLSFIFHAQAFKASVIFMIIFIALISLSALNYVTNYENKHYYKSLVTTLFLNVLKHISSFRYCLQH